MRLALFTVMAIQAAHAIKLEGTDQLNLDEHQLAQLDAFAESVNSQDTLSEALSKVMATLNNQGNGQVLAQVAEAAKDAAAKKPDAAVSVPKTVQVPTPAGGAKERGTNIAITTPSDQHITIYVPENPNAKVTIKKTENVRIVENDDAVDKNAEIKKAIGDKIRGELVKKALAGGDDSAAKKKEQDEV